MNYNISEGKLDCYNIENGTNITKEQLDAHVNRSVAHGVGQLLDTLNLIERDFYRDRSYHLDLPPDELLPFKEYIKLLKKAVKQYRAG